MRVTRCWHPERMLQRDLPGGAVEEIGAAHHVRYTLQRIIDDHRELVGEGAIAAANYDIPAFAQLVVAPPLQAVLHRHHAGIHAKARRRWSAASGAFTAAAW